MPSVIVLLSPYCCCGSAVYLVTECNHLLLLFCCRPCCPSLVLLSPQQCHHHHVTQHLRQLCPSGVTLSCHLAHIPEMVFQLWKEPSVIVASVLLFVIAKVVYKKNRNVGRPPVVSYLVPWVGSAIDLGKSPDAFFRRAMYVEAVTYLVGRYGLLVGFQCQTRRHLYGQSLWTEYHLRHFTTREEFPCRDVCLLTFPAS